MRLLTLQDLLQTYWSGKGYYERRLTPSVGGRPNKKRNDDNFDRHPNEVVKHEASRMASNAQPLQVSLLTFFLVFLPGLALRTSFWDDSEVSVAVSLVFKQKMRCLLSICINCEGCTHLISSKIQSVVSQIWSNLPFTRWGGYGHNPHLCKLKKIVAEFESDQM